MKAKYFLFLFICASFAIIGCSRSSSHDDSDESSSSSSEPENTALVVDLDYPSKKVTQLIETINEKLPVSFDSFSLQSATYNSDTNCVNFLILTEDGISPSFFQSEQDIFKHSFINGIKSTNQDFLNALKNARSQINLRIKARHDTQSINIVITPEELRQILSPQNVSYSTNPGNIQELRSSVEETNELCPIQINDNTILSGASIEDDLVVFSYTIDDSLAPALFSSLSDDEIVDHFKTTFINFFPTLVAAKSSDISLFQTIVATGYSLVYRYSLTSSGRNIYFSLSNDELNQLLTDNLRP